MTSTMAFDTLQKAFCEPGCPLCNVERAVAERYFQYLLGENARNPVILQALEPSLGYCPVHTLDLVAFEQKIMDNPLATNFIYERVIEAAQKRITNWKPRPAPFQFLQGVWDRSARRFGWPVFHSQHRLREGECPVCSSIKAINQSTLIALLEGIDIENLETVLGYRSSTGLCLRHLEMALQVGSLDYPGAYQWIIDDTMRRLAEQHMGLREYLRKNRLENRGERMMPQEESAWRTVLSWFTSIREESFQRPAGLAKSPAQGKKHK